MIQHELDLIRKVLPHNVLRASYVAGGAAIAPQSAGDIDVWTFLPPGTFPHPQGTFQLPTEADVLQDRIARMLREHGAPGHQRMLYGSSPNDDPAGCPQGLTPEDEDCQKYRLAIGNDWMELEIRLLLTYAPRPGTGEKIQFLSVSKPKATIWDLLERFDISSQAWAIGLDPFDRLPYSVLATSTLPSALPRVVRWNTPESTMNRLMKLCERYGWDIRTHPDLPRLQLEIAAKAPDGYNQGLALSRPFTSPF